MANRIDLSNILINFLKKARYERHIEEGTLEENQFYAVTDGNEKTEYGDLFGNIENQADLYNALYASRLFKMEMCNDARGYDIVHKLYDRREFDLSKFTVVGNPTISEDGIASGFSSGNYIDTNYSINTINSQNLNIDTSFTTSSDVTTKQYILHSKIYAQLAVHINNGQLMFNVGKNNAWLGDTIINTVTNNTRYNLNLNFTPSGITYTLKTNDTIITNFVADKTMLGDTQNMNLWLGVTRSRTVPFLGLINLPSFSITVDGEEVFNGLKDLTQYDTYTLPSSEVITIPYIPSVDGVKIVDVAYKPLVDQLYTETGMGNYIIIDETNKTFRLPLPDIYSQIENKTSFTLRKWED